MAKTVEIYQVELPGDLFEKDEKWTERILESAIDQARDNAKTFAIPCHWEATIVDGDADSNSVKIRVVRTRNKTDAEDDAVKATYTSVWDGGVKITTKCKYAPATKMVFDIGDSDLDGVENLEDEYVTLPDGTELRSSDGVIFDY